MSSGASSRYSWRSRCSSDSNSTSGPSDWGSHPSPKRAVRRSAAGDDPPTQMGGRGAWTGRGLSPTAGGLPSSARSVGNSSPTPPAMPRWPRRWPAPGRSNSGPMRSNSSATWPAPTPQMTRPPDRASRVANSLAARSGCRSGDHVDVGEQPDRRGDPGQPPEGGDGVVPGGAHGPGQPLGDEGVVAHPDVEEAGRLAGQRHLGQLVGPGLQLPGLHVDGRLRLDRELHPEDGAAPGQHGDDVGGRGQRRVAHAGQRTSRVAAPRRQPANRPATRPAVRRCPNWVASTRARL